MTIEKARKVLGQRATTMTDDEILGLLAVFETLADGILDKYEVKVFGKTVKKLTIGHEI